MLAILRLSLAHTLAEPLMPDSENVPIDSQITERLFNQCAVCLFLISTNNTTGMTIVIHHARQGHFCHPLVMSFIVCLGETTRGYPYAESLVANLKQNLSNVFNIKVEHQ